MRREKEWMERNSKKKEREIMKSNDINVFRLCNRKCE